MAPWPSRRDIPGATGFAGSRYWFFLTRSSFKRLLTPLHLTTLMYVLTLAVLNPTSRVNLIRVLFVLFFRQVPSLLQLIVCCVYYGKARGPRLASRSLRLPLSQALLRVGGVPHIQRTARVHRSRQGSAASRTTATGSGRVEARSHMPMSNSSAAALVPELGGEGLEEADGDPGVARAARSTRDVEPVAGNERSGGVVVTQQQLWRHDLMGVAVVSPAMISARGFAACA